MIRLKTDFKRWLNHVIALFVVLSLVFPSKSFHRTIFHPIKTLPVSSFGTCYYQLPRKVGLGRAWVIEGEALLYGLSRVNCRCLDSSHLKFCSVQIDPFITLVLHER